MSAYFKIRLARCYTIHTSSFTIILTTDTQSIGTETSGTEAIINLDRVAPQRKHSLSQLQQDRKCTYNVTLRRVLAAIAAVEKQKVLHILSVCL